MGHTTPLRALFHEAFLPGKTSYEESRKRFSLSPTPHETVLLFRTDDDKLTKKGPGPVTTFADHFGISPGERRSDLLLFYALEEPGKDVKRKLVFIELKGSDLKGAVEQLSCMVRAVKKKLSPIFGKSFFDPQHMLAVVITDRAGVDTSFKNAQTKFQLEFRFPVEPCHPKQEPELRKLLRQ
jgi:hypothetical protein